MRKIASILSKKEPHFHTVLSHSNIDDAISQMCCENVEYLIVVDSEEKYIGLITEHDITTKVLYQKKDLNKMTVESIISIDLPPATTDDTVEQCMQLMEQHHVRYVPVFDNLDFKGVISSEDILSEAVENREKIFDGTLYREVYQRVLIL